ncbi:MAG: NAD(P)H-dependent oxidoreductase [bacterium]
MPKTLVLFYSRRGATAALAEAVAEGARSVRFSEVTIRRLDDLASPDTIAADPDWTTSRDALAARYQTLGHIDELASYDGIILGSPAIDGDVCAEVKQVLEQAAALRSNGAFANTVGSAFSPGQAQQAATWSLLSSLGQLGMILVPSGYDDADPVAAAGQGKRVADVVSWVTHARSHSHAESPAPTHTHSHPHPHKH